MNMDLAGYSLYNASHVDGIIHDDWRVLWVDVENQRTTADGSVGDPYSSIQTACTAIANNPDYSAGNATPWLVIVLAGDYDEAVTVPGKGVIDFLFVGAVTIGSGATNRNISRTCDYNDQIPTVTPRMSLMGLASVNLVGGSGLRLYGQIVLDDTNGTVDQHLSLNNVYADATSGSAIDGSSSAGDIVTRIVESVIWGINAPTMALRARHSVFSDTVTVDELKYALGSQFDAAITVSTAPSPSLGLAGFIGCYIGDDFTGPASSFVVDPLSESSFNDYGGSLLGGATVVQLAPIASYTSDLDCGTF